MLFVDEADYELFGFFLFFYPVDYFFCSIGWDYYYSIVVADYYVAGHHEYAADVDGFTFFEGFEEWKVARW